MIKVSVIIPVYNGEKYIKQCLDSILKQTLEQIEIIIINDASSDATSEILQDYGSIYTDKIKIVHNKQNEGQGKSRNIGINIAKGEFITFIDADDEIEQNMLEKMYNCAKNKNADLVLCDYYEIRKNKKVMIKSIPEKTLNIKKDYSVYIASPWGKLIKTELLTKNELKFLEIEAYEDISLMPVLSAYTDKIVYIEKPLYIYYVRDGSTMRQKVFNHKLLSIYDALENLVRCFEKTKMLDNYKEELEFIYIKHLLYGGAGRFLEYKEGRKEISKIVYIIKNKYPNWKKNKYYQKQDKLFKLNCNIFYSNKLFIIVPFRTLINHRKKHK